jgi:hypothetical protein
MIEVSRASQQSIEIYNRNLSKQADIRNQEKILEERRNKHCKEIDEQKRIEMARRMNSAVGQNIDRMA